MKKDKVQATKAQPETKKQQVKREKEEEKVLT